MPDPIRASIGGYFGLELPIGRAWHKGAAALNSGRNALQYLLLSKLPSKIYIPQFTCAAIAEAVSKLGIAFERYDIDEAMEPIFDFGRVADSEVFLYTNYFGLKNHFVQRLPIRGCKVIVDNAQSFFSPRVNNLDTFYSPRKFFGVPDGGYAYGGTVRQLERDFSSARTAHLLVRHDESAQAGYTTYLANEELFSSLPIRSMSTLSSRILDSIDYAEVIIKRRKNFQQLHDELSSYNDLPIDDDCERVALTYPYLSKDFKLRERLQSYKIFTANYWPAVTPAVRKSSVEYKYATQIVHLPLDQRYEDSDMTKILNLVLNNPHA